jgi:glycosyltransferase involved in cell wall biosynthesis
VRVLHVAPSVGPLRGGPSFVIRTVTQGLRQAGCEVEVACTDDNGPERLNVITGSAVLEDAIPYWYFPRQLPFYSVSLPFGQWIRTNAKRFDLIHIHALFSYCPTVTALAARQANIPYIVRPLGVLNRWGMANRRPGLKKLSLRYLEGPIIESAAAMHFTSQMECDEATTLGYRFHPAVIPNPVEIPAASRQRGYLRSKYPHLRDKTIILFLSRIDQKKGLDLLFPAFAPLKQQAALVIAGSGTAEAMATARQLQQASGLSDQDVTWAGFVEGDEKIATLDDSDLYILPSYSENFGVSVVEAMARSLPVIVTDQVALHSAVAQAGAGLVTSCQVNELTNAIAQLVAAPELRQAMGQRAITLSQKFSPRAVAGELVQLYQQILNQQGRSAA